MARYSWLFAAVLSALFAAAGLSLAEDSDGWTSVRSEDGVSVSTREESGANIAHFRGQAVVVGPLLHVLSVILDGARTKEWAHGVSNSRVVKRLDARTEIIHTRSPQPWPVRDRDLVMRRSVQVVTAGQEYRVHVTCVPDAVPEREDAVRVQRCENGFVLRKVGDDKTFVEFSVRADPGGKSPAWFTGWVARNIPLQTLLGLRRQVTKTRGQYDEAIRTWAAAE